MAKSTKPEIKVDIRGDSGYGGGSISIKILAGEDGKSIPPEPVGKYGPEWYQWYYAYGEGANKSSGPTTAWYSDMISQESCCGFTVLTGFGYDNGETPKSAKKLFQTYVKECGKALHDALKKSDVRYVSAYVPDTKEYANTTALMIAAGFIESVSVKSEHGDYTNTRWEWYPKKVKRNEKIVSAFDV